ncbi:unnamed protein product [Prunus armeniaca]|uniref:KEN domain-containing protein n=1 Tax=Prunus armeniaca TaxID=36596 RepID=A0A6J5XHF7_PRUAR|nr:unnamed protein product [Prunus armeniaca]CAB4311385.1 unnamed protein product [Prunus armeniaca]
MEVDRDLIDDAYIDYIKSQWRNNNSKDIVMGSRIDYASGKQHYNGELFFKENKLGRTPVTIRDDPSKLLRFLRNIYAHYRQYGDMEKIKEVDAILRTLWVDFFDMIHVIT